MFDSILPNKPKSDNASSVNKTGAQSFVQAFCPENLPPIHEFSRSIIQAWAERASLGIDALITFRSALHRWQAQGHVPDEEFIRAGEMLDQAHLGDWFDDLMITALQLSARRTPTRRTPKGE